MQGVMEVETKKHTVYMHTCLKGKRYVGITGQDVLRRWRNGNGYKNNQFFHRTIVKYGWENITKEIIAENLSFSEACGMERELIISLKLNDLKYGYNLTFGGEGTPGHKVSESTRKLFSEKASGMNNPNFGRCGEKHPLYGVRGGKSANAKKVTCLNTMQTFNSVIEASEEMNCLASSISSCCSGISDRKTTGVHPITKEKLMWVFSEQLENMSEKEINSYINDKQIRKPQSFETKNKIGKTNGHPVICLNTNEIFYSIQEASRKYNAPYSGIGKCCKELQRFSGKHPITKERLAWKYHIEISNELESAK